MLNYGAEKEENLCIALVTGGKPGIECLKAFLSTKPGGQAAILGLNTLEKWETPSVKKCVAEAGTLKRGAPEFKRLVMYTIDEYFSGIEPKLPPLAHPRTGEAFQKELTPQQSIPDE